MKLFKSRKALVITAAVVAVTGSLVGAGAAFAAADCTNLKYPLCARSVASLQVVDGSLITNDLHPSVRAKLNQVGTGEQGPAGPVGPAGPQGEAGPKGDPGASGVSGYEVIAKEVDFPAGDADAPPFAVTVACPEGKVPVGGGYKVDRSAGINVFHNMAGGLAETEAGTWTATGWDVKATNVGANTNITAFVTCAQVG